jgi:threonine dehydratase
MQKQEQRFSSKLRTCKELARSSFGVREIFFVCFFKESSLQGALNALLQFSDEQRKVGLVLFVSRFLLAL